MLKAIRAMLFYFSRWREDERERKEALGEIMRNGWRSQTVVNAQMNKQIRNYRRYQDVSYHR